MNTAVVASEDRSHQDESRQPCMPVDALRLTHDLTLRDGSVVHVRAIRADDTARLQAFHAHLSMDSIIWRFFRSVPSLSDEQARQFTHVDYRDRMALVATRDVVTRDVVTRDVVTRDEDATEEILTEEILTEEILTEEILAVVRYDRMAGAQETEHKAGAQEAEVAFVVQDAWQGQGIATALLHELAAYARTQGVERFVALTMGANVRMLEVLHKCGFPCRTRYDGGDIIATLDITAPPRALPWEPGEPGGPGEPGEPAPDNTQEQ
jgi:GNAT superfamily N-acetyltransferase